MHAIIKVLVTRGISKGGGGGESKIPLLPLITLNDNIEL